MTLPEKDTIISILLPSLRGGGAERVMLNIANTLATARYDVDLALVQATGPYLADVNQNVAIVDLGSHRSSTAIPSLIRYLRHRRPSTLICSLPHISVIGLIAKYLSMTNAKLIIVEHNTISQTVSNAASRRTKFLPTLMRLLYPHSDHIIGVSKGVAEDLEKTIRLPNGSVSVVYNPVITPNFEEMSCQPLAHPWFTPTSPPVVLGIGRLTLAKNFSLLVESFSEVRQKVEAKLIILGEGPQRDSLADLISSLGLENDVLLPGFVDNPYPFIKQSALFVLSSRWEGLPTVLIEAVACGTPIVSTDCPSGPREILQNGKLGTLVPLCSKSALADAIHHNLVNHHTSAPNESWEFFSLDYAVARYTEIIQKVLATP